MRLLAGDLEEVAAGWRSGPAASVAVFLLEFVKLWLPSRLWRAAAHGVLGWALFPLRHLDLAFLCSPEAGRLGNHADLWLRKALS